MNRDFAILNIFQSEVERAFAFLSSDCGFAPPCLSIDHKTSQATVTFKGKNLAVQLILDEFAEDIDCKIAAVSEGEVTKSYGRDENGAVVRESLYSRLVRKGVRESLFTKVSGMPLQSRISITVEDFARMLRNHGKDILADSSSALSA